MGKVLPGYNKSVKSLRAKAGISTGMLEDEPPGGRDEAESEGERRADDHL